MAFPTAGRRLCSLPLRLLPGLFAIALASVAARAQPQAEMYRGTPEDQQACTDDAFRLCGQFVPDAPRIVQCLIANKPKLSPACHEVFSRNDPKKPVRRRHHRQ